MHVLLLYSGIVLIAVPFMMMIGFATYIFFSFMRDDDMISGIVNVAVLIMLLGAVFIGAYYAIRAFA